MTETQIISAVVVVVVVLAFPLLRKLGSGIVDILLLPVTLFGDVGGALLSNPVLALLFVALVAALSFVAGRGT